MLDDTKQCLIVCTAIALVVMCFIGGCSYTLQSDNEHDLKRVCIQSNASWRDGNCVR